MPLVINNNTCWFHAFNTFGFRLSIRINFCTSNNIYYYYLLLLSHKPYEIDYFFSLYNVFIKKYIIYYSQLTVKMV